VIRGFAPGNGPCPAQKRKTDPALGVGRDRPPIELSRLPSSGFPGTLAFHRVQSNGHEPIEFIDPLRRFFIAHPLMDFRRPSRRRLF